MLAVLVDDVAGMFPDAVAGILHDVRHEFVERQLGIIRCVVAAAGRRGASGLFGRGDLPGSLGLLDRCGRLRLLGLVRLFRRPAGFSARRQRQQHRRRAHAPFYTHTHSSPGSGRPFGIRPGMPLRGIGRSRRDGTSVTVMLRLQRAAGPRVSGRLGAQTGTSGPCPPGFAPRSRRDSRAGDHIVGGQAAIRAAPSCGN